MPRRTRFLVSTAAAATVLLWPAVAGAAATGNGTTWRANVSTTGVQADKPSTRARISHDGNHVVYQTNATTLASNDNSWQDIYWTDLTKPSAPVTKRVSVGY